MKIDGVKINKKNTVDYIEYLSRDLNDKDNKSIITMIMALQHLDNRESWVQTLNLTVGLGSAISTIYLVPTTSVYLFSAGLATSIITCYNAFSSFLKSVDYSAMSKKLIDTLMHRYDNVLEAYMSIATITQTVEREDLLDFFKKANEFNN